mgnify:CR=1 FL=1
MIDPVTLFLGIMQIPTQLGAVYFAYRLTKVTGSFLGWSLVIAALILQTIRRVIALMIEVGAMTGFAGPLVFAEKSLLPLMISILLLVAMYTLVNTFEQQSKRP